MAALHSDHVCNPLLSPGLASVGSRFVVSHALSVALTIPNLSEAPVFPLSHKHHALLVIAFWWRPPRPRLVVVANLRPQQYLSDLGVTMASGHCNVNMGHHPLEVSRGPVASTASECPLQGQEVDTA